ncbi:hypothetical protein BCR32DRAFT_295289 [Anaeromyces robustus]|uniref:Cytoplasmic dynein 2 light intermediate chain 1 n=1 Tax=Anaeromyces robustus TaxID=1754192 RepID=A0A1Y1WWX7_9FUNG|nr:hypothetical protein BCR32DRAFT_295289 [Anaeromyces robustus]|eukprot:ORX77952.1 hypothetical protein BCR32DRAFT_295289 [Anaeromyces robustus]
MISHHHSNNNSANQSSISLNEIQNNNDTHSHFPNSKSNSIESLNSEKQKKLLQKRKSNNSSTKSLNTSVNTKNLWNLCKIEKEKEKKDTNKVELNDIGIESSIFLAGSSEGGKSTLISNIFDKNSSNNVSSNTLLLDYTYRHNNRTKGLNSLKDTIHIWELANGIMFKEFLKIPINEHNINNAVVVIVLDLSKPENIIDEYKEIIEIVNTRVDGLLKSLEKRGSRRPKALTLYSWKKYGNEHPDKEFIHPTIIPSIIVGSKYDKFKNYESEAKKFICKMLRYIAHINGSSLIFYNQNDEAMAQKCKQMLFHYIYRHEAPSNLTDHNKPILVMAGTDSLNSIGLPPNCNATNPQRLSLIDWTNIYETFFKKENKTKNFSIDLSKFPEPIIDNLKIEKDEEYLKYCQKNEKEANEKLKLGNISSSGNSPSEERKFGNIYSRSRAAGLATY